jgi:methionine-rich copper-binding protein CopC
MMPIFSKLPGRLLHVLARSPLLVLFAYTGGAAAHAIIIESSPAVNAEVEGPRVPVDLRFNSRIDKGRSRLNLVPPGAAAARVVFPTDGDPDHIVTEVKAPLPGKYLLEWQVLGLDGHITRGFIPFTVKTP